MQVEWDDGVVYDETVMFLHSGIGGEAHFRVLWVQGGDGEEKMTFKAKNPPMIAKLLWGLD